MSKEQILKNKIKDLETIIKNIKNQLKIFEEQKEDEIKDINKTHEAEIKKMQEFIDSTIASYNNLISELEKTKEESKEYKKQVEELKEANDKLQGKAMKNSTNSSIPPSKDENKKVVNHREKTERKQGGQKGREGKTLTREKAEELIQSGKVEVIEEEYWDEEAKTTTVKYVVDIKTVTVIKKITIHGKEEDKTSKGTGEEGIKKEEVPSYLKTKSAVIYGNKIKVLVGIMAELEVIAYDRMQEFINILTDGVLEVSHGSLVNWVGSLSNKSKKLVKKIGKRIKKQPLIHTDLTNTKVNGKKAYVRNYSTDMLTLYKPSSNKTIDAIKSHNILTDYNGYIMHDHEVGLFNFSKKERNIDCWIHLGRELKYVQETTKNPWAQEIWELGWEANKKREEYREKGIKSFTPEEIEEFNNRYDEILARGYEQNEKTSSKYYKDKELPVIKRLSKYKNAYMLFVTDFMLPFDNNLSERDLRMVKTKKKIIGSYRSFEGLKDYCNISTVISTCKKQSVSFFDVLTKLMNDEPVIITKEGYIKIA